MDSDEEAAFDAIVIASSTKNIKRKKGERKKWVKPWL